VGNELEFKAMHNHPFPPPCLSNLENMLHVPELIKILIFMSHFIINNHVCIRFYHNFWIFFFLKDLQRRMSIMICYTSGDLYPPQSLVIKSLIHPFLHPLIMFYGIIGTFKSICFTCFTLP